MRRVPARRPVLHRGAVGTAINPVTHTNWEGVGVVPDVAVPAGRALEEAHRLAIQDLAARMPAL